MLVFTNAYDEKDYLTAQKKMISFPAICVIFALFILLSIVHDNIAYFNPPEDNLVTANFAFCLALYAIMLIFLVAHGIEFFKWSLPARINKIAGNIARLVLNGGFENVIIILVAICEGLHLLSQLNSRNCPSCSSTMSGFCCDTSGQNGSDQPLSNHEFPVYQMLFGYISIKVLPMYVCSIHRYVALMAWVVLTAFVVAAHILKNTQGRAFTVLFILLFLFSIYEYQRSAMHRYSTSKEQLSYEVHKVESQNDASGGINNKLNRALINQILPRKIADSIINGKSVEPEHFEEVTIFFSDVVGFTNICAAVTPLQVVKMLNDLYTVMDYCTSLFPLYKVETIGDAYMLVGGLPVRDAHHALQIADFALVVQRAVQLVKSPLDGTSINIRIGIHSGPAMAGVVGNLMPRYCLFGDTVNTASRMESNGSPGLIHCSEKTAHILMKSDRHMLSSRGEIDVKGKGKMHTYWLDKAQAHNQYSNETAIQRAVDKLKALLDANHQPVYVDTLVATRTNLPRNADGTVNSNGIKVLIVEDSPSQQKILMHRIKTANPTWDVSAADDGEHAIEKLRAGKFQFHVVFVDENLSMNNGLYGHELVAVMRKNFNMNECVIIACTSNPGKVEYDLRQAGVDHVWPKPPPAPAEIRLKINELLNYRVNLAEKNEQNERSSRRRGSV